ncbi:C2 family cysteine protease [Streptomyces sp. NPDC002328]|uniref:C2 family cysteine protease n=1 Tax=Streptomyces sp. NPDC002328 TaxID=3364642 RepID=UPI0036BA4704
MTTAEAQSEAASDHRISAPEFPDSKDTRAEPEAPEEHQGVEEAEEHGDVGDPEEPQEFQEAEKPERQVELEGQEEPEEPGVRGEHGGSADASGDRSHRGYAEGVEPAEPAEPAEVAASAEPAAEPPESPEPAEPTELEEAEEAVTASADDVLVRGEFLDRVKSVFGGGGADRVREISDSVDKPDFQVPEKMYPPDRYGTPLDRPDGTRTPLFEGVPTREQSKQGELGDCGVIATLGAVAGHRPQDIMNCVKENEDGTYEVLFHEAKSVGVGRYEPTGNVVRLTVTADLPVHDEIPDRPAFADSVDTGAAWAPILEKAVAGVDQTWSEERGASWKMTHNRPDELRAGYVRLDDGTKSGERAELMVQLTGQPAETWDLPTGYDYEGRSVRRQVMDHFAEQLDAGCPIVVGTRKPSKEEIPLPKDLIGGHAYEVTEVDDRGFIHLRNPHNRDHPQPLTFKEFKDSCLPLYTTLDPK